MSNATKGGPLLARRVFEAHLLEVKRLFERRGIDGLKQIYDLARANLGERLRSVGSTSDKVGPLTLRAMQAQADAIVAKLGSDFAKHLVDVGHSAAELGATHAVREFSILEQRFRGTTPNLRLEQPSIFMGMVDGVESSLLRRKSLVAGTWTAGAVMGMERQLAGAAATGQPLEDVVRRLMSDQGLVEEERYKAERIVRTEMAYSMNATKHEATVRVRDELGDQTMRKKLIETLTDERPGDDSFLVHGQTVELDKPFVWMRRVKGGGYVREEYMFPPNRPNDRAVVIPWSLEWEETELEKPLTLAELRTAPPTRWRKKVGVKIPPGHKPGLPYGKRPIRKTKKEAPPPEVPIASKVVESEAPDFVIPSQEKITAEKNVSKVARAMFGKQVSDEEIAALGGLSNAKVMISARENSIRITAERWSDGKQIYTSRTVGTSPDGSAYIRNNLFEVPKSMQGSGIGLEAFAQQVENAVRLGVSRITANCYRSDPEFNGYYTWARFGYDGKLPEDIAEQTGLSTISDLMKTPEGRALWKEKGTSFEGTFDTTPGSLSMRTFEAYRNERASKVKK